MPSLVLLWLDNKCFSPLLWSQLTQVALQQQLSDSPPTPAATSHPLRFDNYFTAERGHCPGAPGSTLKECANETTAQIAQRVDNEDPLTQLHPGKVQTERTAEMMLPAARDTTAGTHPGNPGFLPSLLPTQSGLSQDRASPAQPTIFHCIGTANPYRPFPPFPDTAHPPSPPFEDAFIRLQTLSGKGDLLLCVGTVPRKMGCWSQGTTVI